LIVSRSGLRDGLNWGGYYNDPLGVSE